MLQDNSDEFQDFPVTSEEPKLSEKEIAAIKHAHSFKPYAMKDDYKSDKAYRKGGIPLKDDD